MLDDPKAGEYAARPALRRAAESLSDLLGIADSEGARLPGC
ncbi:hypothetical protein [Streptomyces reniochalinae]|nr:hypothetical protein [Streptomyces reniochalinae]